MNSQQQFDQLARQFDLKPADFNFLDLIPVIEMMWIDGKNQPGELKVLYQFVIEHIAYLDQVASIQAISVADANDFLDRFAHKRPNAELVKELRIMIAESETVTEKRKLTILEYCLDISAACVTQYPYKNRARIQNIEKNFLLQLLGEFNISTQRACVVLEDLNNATKVS